MKFLLSSVIVLSLTCSVFAAKFESGKCWQLIKTKDFTSIVNYLKTNNECTAFYEKTQYILFSLVESGRVKKTITVSNFESTIDATIANSKLSFTDDEKIICKLFCYSRSKFAGINKLNLIDNFEVFFNKYSTKFDQLAMNKTYTNIIATSIAIMSYNSKKPNFERMLKYSLLSTSVNNVNFSLIAAKQVGPTRYC